MAFRKPLVLGPNGFPQQLQNTDTLLAPVSGMDLEALLNGDSVPLVAGMVVYVSAAGTVKRANASALATCAGSLGIVCDASIAVGSTGNIAISGPVQLTVAQWDAIITGDSTGLAFGSWYFLDPSTPGNLSANPPSTVGQVVIPVGIAQDSQTLKLAFGDPILL